MKTQTLCTILAAWALSACTGAGTSDDSMYLTGTEEAAVTTANGVPACIQPHKVLICHIPPGNPANAHEICVSEHAVAPHQAQHGDLLGACAPDDDPPPPDAGSEPDAGHDDGHDGGVIP